MSDDIGSYYEAKRTKAGELARQLVILLEATPWDIKAIKRTRLALEQARYVGD